MPFGLVSAPVFIRMRRKLHLGENSGLFFIIFLLLLLLKNRIIILNSTHTVLSKLCHSGLTAWPSKIKEGFQELEFLGHTVGYRKAKPIANKVEEIFHLNEKSKVFKYAKWPSKWLTNESLVWDLMKKKKKWKKWCWFLIDFIFCRLAETAVSGSPSVTWLLRSDVSLGSQCGCHLRLFIECVCVWLTKSSTMPAYCVAANCNNSQATQSITMHEFLLWGENGSNLYNSNELTLMLCLSHAHLCSKYFIECDFVNFMAEYQMGFASKRNL